MANTVSTSNRPRKTYNPANVVSVRNFDQAPIIGARKLEQSREKSITAPDLVTLLDQRKAAKCLKWWRERRGSNPRPPA